MLRVVIDPGVLVAALITPDGPPAAIVQAMRRGEIEVVLTPHLIAELLDVVQRDKFRRWFTRAEAEQYVAGIARIGLTVRDPDQDAAYTRDPDDDYLIAAALVSGAACIVSGDADLLEATLPIPVRTPRDIVDELSPR